MENTHMENTATDNVTAYIRAYSKTSHTDGRSKRRGNKRHEEKVMAGFHHMLPVYPYQCLTFDTETLTTPDKTLLYGFYMLTGYSRDEVLDMFLSGTLIPEKRDVIREVGVFYGDDLTTEEVKIVRTHAQNTKLSDLGALLGVAVQSIDMHLRVKSTEQFVEWMYCLARREHLLVIGLNLPFDLSRLLPASTSWHEGTGKHKGAFCLELAEDKPCIRIYHVGFAKNLYSLEQAFHMENGRKVRDRAYENMHFLDLSQLSGALLGPGAWSLHALGKTLNISSELRKLERPEEDYRPTPEKLTYALQDVIATYACYMRLRDLYAKHDLSEQTDVWNLVSGASLGKAYLKKIGIRSFSEQHPQFPQEVVGYAMNAFMGGRSEIGVRLKPVRGRLRDYTSEYPLVCSLLGLQRYWLAESITVNRDALDKVQAILNLSVYELLDFLHDPSNWKDLVILCKVRLSTGCDRFPIRANYGIMEDQNQTATSTNIALPFVSSDVDAWYCIQDVIASKLLTGCTPEVIEAIELVASTEQYKVNPINIMGEQSARIDLTRDEFFTRIIDLKQEYDALAKGATTPEAKEYNTSIKTALKLLANSTSYGSLVEVRTSEPSDKTGGEEVVYFDASGKQCYAMVERTEQPGKYFSPLGPFITASGRLMIAIAERLGMDAGFGLVNEQGNRSVFAFCDTDSMFYVCPDGMEWEEFVRKDDAIGEWFQTLSPYANNAEVFKLERPDAYCFAISAKRYCLYTIEERDEEIEAVVLRKVGRSTRYVREMQTVTRRIPIMLKVSSHGLGAIQDPYKRDADGKSLSQFPEIPAPSPSLGVRRWIYDLFYKGVYAIENNMNVRGNMVLQHHPITGVPILNGSEIGLTEVCQHQVTITSPHLLRTYNKLVNIRPFSFFTLLPDPSIIGLMFFNNSLEMDITNALDRGEDKETVQKMMSEKQGKMAYYQSLAKAHTPLYSASLVTSTLYPLFRCDNNEEVPDYIRLKSVSDMLIKYFQHSEMKAANYDGWGVMQMRHIHITGVKYMGKEISERFEETSEEALGLIRHWDVMEYGRGDEANIEATEMFLRKLRRYDMHDLMYVSGLHRAAIDDTLNKRRHPANKTLVALDKALSFIEIGRAHV